MVNIVLKVSIMVDQARNPDAGSKVTASLASVVRLARVEGAEHSTVIAELRGAETARLEMLQEAIAPVLAQVPDGIDLFDPGLVPGDHPRLFIDMIGFVEMARDRRVYRFVQDTRHGRIVMAESDKIDVMVAAIRSYVARRLIERERALASDQTVEMAARAFVDDHRQAEPARMQPARAQALPAKTKAPLAGDMPVAPALRAKHRRRSLWATGMRFLIEFLGAFTLGALLLAAAFAAFYISYPPVRLWLSAHFGWPPT